MSTLDSGIILKQYFAIKAITMVFATLIDYPIAVSVLSMLNATPKVSLGFTIIINIASSIATLLFIFIKSITNTYFKVTTVIGSLCCTFILIICLSIYTESIFLFMLGNIFTYVLFNIITITWMNILSSSEVIEVDKVKTITTSTAVGLIFSTAMTFIIKFIITIGYIFVYIIAFILCIVLTCIRPLVINRVKPKSKIFKKLNIKDIIDMFKNKSIRLFFICSFLFTIGWSGGSLFISNGFIIDNKNMQYAFSNAIIIRTILRAFIFYFGGYIIDKFGIETNKIILCIIGLLSALAPLSFLFLVNTKLFGYIVIISTGFAPIANTFLVNHLMTITDKTKFHIGFSIFNFINIPVLFLIPLLGALATANNITFSLVYVVVFIVSGTLLLRQ